MIFLAIFNRVQIITHQTEPGAISSCRDSREGFSVCGPFNFMNTSTNVTAHLARWSKGDPAAMDEVYPLIENELRRLARSMIRRFEPGDTLQATALINEAYIRLAGQRGVAWKNRSHFFAIAATMMRRILLNHHRDGRRKKRWGNAIRVSLSEAAAIAVRRSDDLIDLDDALTKLEAFDARKASIAEMRFFGGMTVEEIADVLGVATITVIREWRMAKAWLNRELGDEH